MPAEQERLRIPLTAIHIDLVKRSISFDAKDRTVAKITLAREGVIFESNPKPTPGQLAKMQTAAAEALASELAVEQDEGEERPSSATAMEGKERQPVTLSGKLKNKPREGHPDAKGHPTAWARLAVHEEERDEAHMYSATFHRHTAKMALALDRNVQITVQGYPHLSDDPKRMDTLSVINILEPRGEGKKRQG